LSKSPDAVGRDDEKREEIRGAIHFEMGKGGQTQEKRCAHTAQQRKRSAIEKRRGRTDVSDYETVEFREKKERERSLLQRCRDARFDESSSKEGRRPSLRAFCRTLLLERSEKVFKGGMETVHAGLQKKKLVHHRATEERKRGRR